MRTFETFLPVNFVASLRNAIDFRVPRLYLCLQFGSSILYYIITKEHECQWPKALQGKSELLRAQNTCQTNGVYTRLCEVFDFFHEAGNFRARSRMLPSAPWMVATQLFGLKIKTLKVPPK